MPELMSQKKFLNAYVPDEKKTVLRNLNQPPSELLVLISSRYFNIFDKTHSMWLKSFDKPQGH